MESDPLKHVDFGTAVFSEATDELAMTAYDDDQLRRYFRDKSFEADYKWLEAKFPGKEIGVGSRSSDEQIWLVSAHSDTEPGDNYLFDRKTHTLTHQYKIREKLPRESLCVHARGALQIFGRPGNSGLPDLAERHSREGIAHCGCSARRPVGAR